MKIIAFIFFSGIDYEIGLEDTIGFEYIQNVQTKSY